MMIVFLSCVKTKRKYQCLAKDMYISDLFSKSYRYAKSLNPRKIYILSAKYGLLELTDKIQPYEMTLKNMSKKERKIWAYKVIEQLKQKAQDFSETAVFLCGKEYREYVSQKFQNAKIPLEGIPFGRQLKFYKENTK